MSEPMAAVRELRRAVALGPGLAEAHSALGRLLIELGAVDEGLSRLDAALGLDPLVPLACGAQGRAFALLGRWDEADAAIERLQANEGSITRWALRARMALWRRLPASAYAQEVPRDAEVGLLWAMGEVIRTPQRPEGLATLEELRRAAHGSARRRVLFLQMHAEILGFLGEREPTLEALRCVSEEGLIDLFWLERCPLFDDLRADPRFVEVLDTVGRRADEILEAYRAL
jgi:serine/threonine-protein kinase